MSKVSIIVPCYNAQDYIKNCIDSIKSQTYQDFEVLMIDDGSKDNTKKIIQKEIKDDQRFSYFYKKNGGLSDARNYGLTRAKGAYVCFIDSDDYISQDYVELLYYSIQKNNSDIAVSYFKRVYKKNEKINVIELSDDGLIKHPAAWNKMYKIELFKKYKIEYLKGYWYEDLNVFLKLMTITNKFSLVEKELYYYIQNSGSIMHTYDHRIFDIYPILEDVEQFSKKQHTYRKNFSKLEYANIYHILIGTIYRASFRDDFSKKMILEIVNYVKNKYPNWYQNEYLKNLPLSYRIYLWFIKHKGYSFIRVLLKTLNKYMNL